jgi:hypothetical protein
MQRGLVCWLRACSPSLSTGPPSTRQFPDGDGGSRPQHALRTVLASMIEHVQRENYL